MENQKVLLIILDGFGEGKNYKYNAITKAKTPYIDSLRKKYPYTTLKTDSEYVGLPKNTMGGSEVGHFTIGAGRVVFQSLEAINQKIKNKSFSEIKELKKAFKYLKKTKKKLHLIGMISDAGVHSHINHLFALLKEAKNYNLENVFIHGFLDGRDVHERSGEKYIKEIQKKIKTLKTGKISSLIGRFYAMDRDQNWERTKKAYELLVNSKRIKANNAIEVLKNEYAKNDKSDYYIPAINLEENGKIENGDVVIFFNYRTDRASQLTEAIVENHFKNKKNPKVRFLAFGEYTKKAPVLFPPEKVKNNLGEILAKNKKTQLRLSETEKSAHVTFFFNSQKKEINKNEDRIIIPSKKVENYKLLPEMSANEITKTLIKILETKENKYDFIVTNYANGDLVGHSGNFEASKKAIETLDKNLKLLIPKALEKNYTIILTADHGNAEYMKYENNDNCPSHTLNPVICMFISKNIYKLVKSKNLGLSSIAPSILEIMNIKKPKEMTGNSIINKSN